jgi:hypothetical protein
VERLILALAAWTLISVPTGLAVGRLLRFGSGETGWVRSGDGSTEYVWSA